MYNFLLIKDLIATAKKEILEFDKIHNRKSLIPATFGFPATNKKWLESAKNNYLKFQKAKDEEKLMYLLNAFVDILKCEIKMKSSKFKDEQVSLLKQKINTSYFNFIITFIEKNIYDNHKIEQHSESLKMAIDVLADENKKLAQNYYLMLKQHVNGYKTHLNLMKLLEENAKNVTSDFTYRIYVLFNSNKDFYDNHKHEFDDFSRKLHSLADEIYFHKNAYYLLLRNKELPKISELEDAIDDIVSTMEPINQILKLYDLQEWKEDKEHLHFILTEAEKYYSDLRKTYTYLQFPRQHYDLKRLLHSRNILKKIEKIYENNYYEINTKKPSFGEIKKRIESTLEDLFRSDLNKYYKIYNSITDLFLFDEKLAEFLKFREHLILKINEERTTNYLKEKLIEFLSEIEKEIMELLESNLIKKLQKASSALELKRIFEAEIENYLKFGDEKLIKKLIDKKKKLLSVISFQEDNQTSKKHKLISQIFAEDLYENEFLDLEDEKVGHDFPIVDRLIVIDNFTLKNFIIYFKNSIRIGRNQDNDIVLPEKWVSSYHCEINLSKELLIDLDSTNGTFINRENEKISQIDLSEVSLFSIAKILQFSMKANKKAVFLDFVKVQDPKKSISKNLILELKNTTFIVTNETSIILDKNEGKNFHQFSENERYINIVVQNKNIIIDGKKYDNLSKIIHVDERFSISF